MKIKKFLSSALYLFVVIGGAVLCGFERQLTYRCFNPTPLGAVLMVFGFLGFIFDYVEYIVDRIKNDKDK